MRLHFQLNVFWGVESKLQTNPMPFHLESVWGAALMLLRGCAMDWDGTNQWVWVKTTVWC